MSIPGKNTIPGIFSTDGYPKSGNISLVASFVTDHFLKYIVFKN